MVKEINHIQLRAARHALNISSMEMGKFLGVADTTLGNHERLKFGEKGFNKFIANHSDQLIEFFANHNIIFPDQYSIVLKVNDDILNAMPKTGGELTRFQLRVARYILNISQAELSKLTGINEGIISMHECKKNIELLYICKKEELTEEKYKQWYLNHGVEFIGHFKVKFEKYVS